MGGARPTVEVDRLLEGGGVAETLDQQRTLAEIRSRLFDRRCKPVTFSRYVLLGQLGAGGAGLVFRAYDPELDRKVAIKLLQATSRDREQESEGRARLRREAQAMARLSHPNVISVFDVGTYDERDLDLPSGGSSDLEIPPRGVFVVMELVEGPDLCGWLEQARRTWREVLEVFLAAARGLAAAHASGLTHRDFKPGNVIVADDGRVRVLDFGLARVLRGPPTEEIATEPRPREAGETPTDDPLSTPLTREGTVMGTPAYMSPEQHVGEPSDASTDQYSFCVALYEALHGQRPFAGEDLDELLARKSQGQLPAEVPPGREVPQWLRNVVAQGLAPRPEDRFASMDALIRALEADPSAVRRRRLGVAAVVACVLGLAAGVSAWQGQAARACTGFEARLHGIWDDATKSRMQAAFLATEAAYASDAWAAFAGRLDAYAQQWIERRTEACEAMIGPAAEAPEIGEARVLCLDGQIREVQELLGVFSAADTDAVKRSVEVASRLPELDDCTSPALLAHGRKPVSGALREAVAKIDQELYRASALREAGKYVEAQQAAERALEDARSAGHAPSETRALYANAQAHFLLDEPEDAEAVARKALLLAERLGEDALAARSQLLLASIADKAGERPVEAEHLALQARARIQRLELGTRDRLEAMLALIVLYNRQDRFEDALGLAREAIDVATRAYGTDNFAVARILQNMGYARASKGEYAEAQRHFERALEIMRASMGPNHPEVGAQLLNVGATLSERGEMDAGRKHTEEAIAVLERGPPGSALALALNNLGAYAERRGDPEGALPLHRRALEIRTALFGTKHASLGFSYENIGSCLNALGRHAEAVDALESALGIWTGAYGPDSGRLVEVIYDLGVAHMALGDPARAIEGFERALVIAEHSEHKSHNKVGLTRFALARLIVARDPTRAKELARAARNDLERGWDAARRVAEVDAWLAAQEK